jgi:hypothetical protein
MLKMFLRLLTLGVAVAALVLTLMNRSDIKWQEKVQDGIIEGVLFRSE